MKLGDLIAQYRAKYNMSQREFARRCDLSNSLISILEKGYNPQTGKEISPDIETYGRIASTMGISLQNLFEVLGDDAKVKLKTWKTTEAEPTEEEEKEIRELFMPEDAVDKEKEKKFQFMFRGMDKMSTEEIDRVISVLRAMFPDNEYFKEEENK